MKIAIIGSGNVGGALAQSFIKANHQVFIGAKFPLSDKSQKLAAKIGNQLFFNINEACTKADIIVITTPPDIVLSILPEIGNVQQKILIDATNSINKKPEGFATVYHALKETLKTDLVVKCFNTTGFENMLNPNYTAEAIDMFCASDNAQSKQTVQELAKSIGFANCYNFGGDDKVILLEQFALSWINLAILQGLGREIAFKLIRR